jgi:hypothetical protein
MSKVLSALFVSVMIAVNILLVRENQRLASALASAEETRRSISEVPPGTVVPALIGRNADGDPANIAYAQDRRRTLLLVFSSSCPVCEENWPTWRAMLEGIDEEEVRVVALDLPSRAPSDYLKRHGLRKNWVIRNVDQKIVAAYRLNLVPQTIIIGPGGRVQATWTGLLSRTHVEQVNNLLTSPVPDPNQQQP